MAPPTVLYLLDYTDLGGGETSFLALMDQWRRSGADPPFRPEVIVTGRGPVAERLEALGVGIHVVGYPLRLRRGPLPWFSLAAARQIGGLMDALRPTVVHANNFFGLTYAGVPARRRRVPLVWTCHGWYELEGMAKPFIARRFATHVACVSEAVRLEAARALGRPDRTSTDYLGILPFQDKDAGGPAGELRDSVRHEFKLSPHAPLIAVLGRFQPIKGHALLLDALPQIRRRVPDLKVWFIGDALFGSREETEHKRLLERRVRAEGLGEAVRFLGFRSDARRLLRSLDALVIPSARESFSMVAVEGLEAGVPVIGPDGWGPREIIDAPATGLRFRPGDQQDLARVVVEALTRSGEAHAFDPAAGPRRVEQLFSAQAHLERTMALYHKLTPGF